MELFKIVAGIILAVIGIFATGSFVYKKFIFKNTETLNSGTIKTKGSNSPIYFSKGDINVNEKEKK